MVVATVEGYVSGQIRKELCLIRIVRLLERRFRRGNLLLRFVALSATCGNAGLCMRPAECPEVLVCFLHVRLAHRSVITGLVPVRGTVDVARLELDARQLIATPAAASKSDLAIKA